jgi:hypothetical protein
MHEWVDIVRKQEAALNPTRELAGRVWRQRLMRTTSLILFAAAFLSVLSVTYAETVAGTSGLPPGFTLTIQDELISLRAEDAPLKAIFEEIGHRMNIQVKVEIPETATASFACEQLPLHEVLKRLGRYVNYGYVERWEQGELRISAITVHSLKVATRPVGSGADGSQDLQDKRPRARLEMNIDPSKYLREKRQPPEAD